MTTPVPPPPKRRPGRPPLPPEELYSAEHRIRCRRTDLECWQAAADATGETLADVTRRLLGGWARRAAMAEVPGE